VASLLIVDGANVVGSRPDGWWKDRAGAARRLQAELRAGVPGYARTILVLEGQARRGVPEGEHESLLIRHAPSDGDSAIVALAAELGAAGEQVTVATADRELRRRVADVGAQVIGPGRLREIVS
jgi:predicted RNA-binding protein with PIN domain